MKLPAIFVCLLIASVLNACAPHDTQCAAIPGGGKYCLQNTALIPAFETQQQVDITFNGKHESMIASIENDAHGLDFVGLTLFGQKIMHLRYNNHDASALLSPDKRLDPALMLALLQLALWPADAVMAGLDPAMQLEESAQARHINRGGKVLMDIQYTDPAIPYRQLAISIPAAQMTLNITSLPEEPSATSGLEP
ncbi:DUF3261 domain-containing protein [Methylobacillus gramineus]|uniref:DUF3261 domain-containing protein n=1 Tax=Methylobacillus gramineus TaxID=755169 RepID=UPI001CFF6ED5|nr:DUF3261 domain-containing protein [Methylobacillus gramineus]MCB5183727.1 DUF3261 domain-containing protein [Methylobacillus gramineus]